ncbi:MAG: lasso peptide biosynthesis protein [Bdellovibrionales bacterium]|nr:lasso peptide biosynthesis protein [Bdellovibrionales bacterium]
MKYLLALEAFVKIIYYSLFLNNRNFKQILEEVKLSSSFFSKYLDNKSLIESFRYNRYILPYLLFNNSCLLISLAYFSMAPKGSKIHINVSENTDSFIAHAWVELNDHTALSTDFQKPLTTSFVFNK